MKKFDPIDMFFITLITSYFITLGFFMITLIFTLIRNRLRKLKLAKAATNTKPSVDVTSTPIPTSINVYAPVFSPLLKTKYTNYYHRLEVEETKEKAPRAKLISLPLKSKLKIKYTKDYKDLIKAYEPEEKTTPKLITNITTIKDKLIEKLKETREKHIIKNSFNKLKTKLSSTKKTKNTKEKPIATKHKKTSTKKKFKLENITWFRKLFMKEVKKESPVEEIKEIKKEQLNIFDALKEELAEDISENKKKKNAASAESNKEIKTTEKEEKKPEPPKNTKDNKQKSGSNKTHPNKNKKGQNNSKKKNNNNKSNNTSKTNNNKNSNNSNKNKNNTNKRANGTIPKKKNTNNKKTSYKKKKNNNSTANNKKKNITS